MVATIGDGSFQYSVQAIWTAAQHDLPIVFVVMRNEEHAILKAFALLEKAPGPGLDIRRRVKCQLSLSLHVSLRL